MVGKHARCARDDEWWPNCACDCHVDTAEAIAAIVRDCTEYDPDSSLGRRLAERIAGLLASEGNK